MVSWWNHVRDADTETICIDNQISLGAEEIAIAKICFEDLHWEQAAVKVKHLHSNNDVFTADIFRRDCEEKGQLQSFSGVGAQGQNAQAE